MERLTIQFNGEWVPKELCTIDREGEADSCNRCGEECELTGKGCGACAIQKCFDRLAEYENTGITPDQIQEIDRLYAEKCRELAECKKQLQRKWIPCNERLPEKRERYIVSAVEGDLEHVTFVNWMPREKTWNLTGTRSYWRVIAWMPLPEPYKPKKKENEWPVWKQRMIGKFLRNSRE